jgi:hypothetical protein
LLVLAQGEPETAPKSIFSSPYVLIPVILLAILALRFLKRGSGAGGGPGPRRSAASPAAQGGEVREDPALRHRGAQDPEVAKLYVELSEFAREMEGRMDTKIAYLRRLIADAEKVMHGLNGAIARAEGVGGAAAGAPPVGSPGSAPAGGAAPAGGGVAPGMDPAAAPPQRPPEPLIDVVIDGAAACERQVVKDRILSLSGAGKSKEAIAEAVGIPKGEVELVLSLHRASQKAIPRNGGKDPKN